MNQNFTIALDAMGGDHGPSVVVPAALQVLTETPNLNIILVGDEATLIKELTSYKRQTDSRLIISTLLSKLQWMKSRQLRYAPKKILPCA